MPGRLGIDFGTSNTVIAVWDEARQEGVPLHIPDFSRQIQQGSESISVIPSLIHYASESQRWVGNQVLQRNLYQANTTFRWMKRYIMNRSPVRRRVGDSLISHAEAGRDFLKSVLTFATEPLDLGGEEIALTAPVEAFEYYEEWLASVAAEARLPRFRLLDEPSAAALGYGAQIQPGDVYLIFDFGGGTLNVSVVLIEPDSEGGPASGQPAGRRCRVLGKAGIDLGGTVIDQWLFQEVLRQNGRRDSDEDVRQISNALLVECEAVKERLSFHDKADLSVVHPETGTALYAEFTQSAFEELLDRHEAFTQVDRTIRRAINSALERGYNEDSVKAVLMVGGSSQIPAVQRAVRRIFGRERVMLNRPLDAVARGAAAFVAGVDFYDHIQHDYGIRYRNQGLYDYRLIVPRGTPYPTPAPVETLQIKATQEGQTQLGIQIFEIGENGRTAPQGLVELVFDPSGAARVTQLTADEQEQRSLFWMNEHQPTFLTADPPATPGAPRFQVSFSVDHNKRLLITARDLQTGKLTHQDYPVVKLS